VHVVDPVTYDYSASCEAFKKCHAMCCVSIITSVCTDMTDSSVLYFLVRLSELKDYACSGINTSIHSARKNTEYLLV